MKPSAMIDQVLAGRSSGQVVEDASLVQRQSASKRNRKKRPNPERSRKARETYRKHRAKYQAAFRKFRKSASGKSFYRKLGRFNSRRVRTEQAGDDLLQSVTGLIDDLSDDPELADIRSSLTDLQGELAYYQEHPEEWTTEIEAEYQEELGDLSLLADVLDEP